MFTKVTQHIIATGWKTLGYRVNQVALDRCISAAAINQNLT